ncbi:MAG: hypothetical protein ACRD3O_17190 [Terriglobia bacterium]
MTLLDAKPAKPKTGFFKYIPLWLLIIIIVVVTVLVVRHFWDYPEERAVTRFMTTLERGDYKRAYQLWQPSPSYQFGDFMHDWGPEGDYGKVSSFQIVSAKSLGSSTVKIMIWVNHEEPLLGLLVDRKSKGIAYALNF